MSGLPPSAQSNGNPEVLPQDTEVTPGYPTPFQDRIDPAFQFSASPDQSSIQQQLPVQQHGLSDPILANGQPASQATPRRASQGPRLRKACDSCSKRKVKCDETGPPCKACKGLDIPCTFERPSRRRGPRNRHADAIKGHQFSSPGESGHSGPSSPTYAAQTLASLAQQQVLSAESICPGSILDLLIDDYFAYVHPIIPVPHEPSFRQAYQMREDHNNPTFLALLASMIGYLVASFPRRLRAHVQAYHREQYFPNPVNLIERCHKIVVEARGLGYLDRELSVHDAVVDYLQGLIAVYTHQWSQCKLYLGECISTINVLGLYKADVSGTDGFAVSDELVPPPKDFILQEVGRRLFWTVYVSIKYLQQIGLSPREINIPPATPTEPYPSLPREIDDIFIESDQILPVPEGTVSELVGFNANVKVFSSYASVCKMELAYGINEIYDFDQQERILKDALGSMKKMLDGLPVELLLAQRPTSAQREKQHYPPPTTDYPNLGIPPPVEPSQTRKEIQFEIQKANIYASQLCTRSYLVEKWANLYDTYGGAEAFKDTNGTSDVAETPESKRIRQQDLADERATVIRDLLKLLERMNLTDMEPSGASFVNKITQIISTLLNLPMNRKSDFHRRLESYLPPLIEFLMRVSRLSPSQQEAEDDEGIRSRQWHSLREPFIKFLREAGY